MNLEGSPQSADATNTIEIILCATNWTGINNLVPSVGNRIEPNECNINYNYY